MKYLVAFAGVALVAVGGCSYHHQGSVTDTFTDPDGKTSTHHRSWDMEGNGPVPGDNRPRGILGGATSWLSPQYGASFGSAEGVQDYLANGRFVREFR